MTRNEINSGYKFGTAAALISQGIIALLSIRERIKVRVRTVERDYS